jgi:multiple sugar transport system permease protein
LWLSNLKGENNTVMRRKVKRIIQWIFFYGFVLAFVFVVLAPFVWMVISSISPQVELTKKPPNWIPEQPTIHRFQALIIGSESGVTMPVATKRFVSSLANSLIISSTTTLLCIIIGSGAAYALVRFRIPGKKHFLIGMLGAQMLPIIVIIIPLYLFMQALDLIDTRQGLILIYCGFMLPTVIWIMYSYFQSIPWELEEAAMIDGCSRLGSLVRIVMPLSGPGVVAVSAFTFLSSWNEFFIALILTASKSKTITVIVTEFATQFGVDYGLMTTGGVIGTIPPLILAFVLQKYIVQGLTAGALKG